MIRISLCMIVKNEEKVLARCLDTIADLMDEIIIVDTGSTDRTKEIAARYTKRIYDFEWVQDFSAARNFAFSLAKMEYIYTADADEILTEENRRQFRYLKECLLPEIDIVQMKYGNQLSHGTVYNFDEEYRPKLFKRQREFVWEGSVHEMVRLEPVIYDSEIVVTHLPEEPHGGRDLENFRNYVRKGARLNKRLHNMYARELYMVGTSEDLDRGMAYFMHSVTDESRDGDEVMEACCIVARAARRTEEPLLFFKYATKAVAAGGCSEICCELGRFYEDAGDYEEAIIWYTNAIHETKPVLSIVTGSTKPLEGMIRCYETMGRNEQAQECREQLEQENFKSDPDRGRQ